jgi:hypothetical protein
MKRLLTEGITDEMLKHCTTRFNLMAFIKQGDYKINLAFKSRCFKSSNEFRYYYGKPNARIMTLGVSGLEKLPALALQRTEKKLSNAC